MAKRTSAMIKCENKGGTWYNGKCVVPKKAKPIEQLKIKIKL